MNSEIDDLGSKRIMDWIVQSPSLDWLTPYSTASSFIVFCHEELNGFHSFHGMTKDKFELLMISLFERFYIERGLK